MRGTGGLAGKSKRPAVCPGGAFGVGFLSRNVPQQGPMACHLVTASGREFTTSRALFFPDTVRSPENASLRVLKVHTRDSPLSPERFAPAVPHFISPQTFSSPTDSFRVTNRHGFRSPMSGTSPLRRSNRRSQKSRSRSLHHRSVVLCSSDNSASTARWISS